MIQNNLIFWGLRGMFVNVSVCVYALFPCCLFVFPLKSLRFIFSMNSNIDDDCRSIFLEGREGEQLFKSS